MCGEENPHVENHAVTGRARSEQPRVGGSGVELWLHEEKQRQAAALQNRSQRPWRR